MRSTPVVTNLVEVKGVTALAAGIAFLVLPEFSTDRIAASGSSRSNETRAVECLGIALVGTDMTADSLHLLDWTSDTSVALSALQVVVACGADLAATGCRSFD